MGVEEKNRAEERSEFDYWTKYVGSLWNGMMDVPGSSHGSEPGKEEKRSDSPKESFESWFSAFGDPGSFFGEANGLPRMTSEMGQKMGEYCADLQRSGLESLIRFTGGMQDKDPSGADRNMIAGFAEIYKKEFRKFLEIPQLGLNRFKQERLNRYIDRYNLFQTTLAEFMHIFYVPVERAAELMREKMEEKFKAGETIEDVKEFHTLWIRILEEQYMAQLKSSDYTELLGRTLSATVQFRSAKEELLFDLIDELPIPTNRDMDELYKEIYHLKKSVKKLSAACAAPQTET